MDISSFKMVGRLYRLGEYIMKIVIVICETDHIYRRTNIVIVNRYKIATIDDSISQFIKSGSSF